MKTCATPSRGRPADAAGGTLCAVHATVNMFVGEAAAPAKPKADPFVALSKYRGEGSSHFPLRAAPNEASDDFSSRLMSLCQNFGECWVDMGSPTATAATNRLFELGTINPIPRRKGQKSYIAVFMLARSKAGDA